MHNEDSIDGFYISIRRHSLCIDPHCFAADNKPSSVCARMVCAARLGCFQLMSCLRSIYTEASMPPAIEEIILKNCIFFDIFVN
jgi:hypothetical protein